MSGKIVTSIFDGMIKMIIGNHSVRNYIILRKGCFIKEKPFKLPFVFLKVNGYISVKV